MTTKFDLNQAGEQRSLDVIPAGTVCTLQMTIRPGGVGDGGWYRKAADGASEGLDAEFTVVDGPFAKRKLWTLFTMRGTKPNHAESGRIALEAFRAMVESAYGIHPKDESEAAKAARDAVAGPADLDGLRFVGRLGVKAAKDNFPAKKTILEIVTPERFGWKKPEQIDRSTLATKQPTSNGAAAGAAATPATAPAANAIARPQWAG